MFSLCLLTHNCPYTVISHLIISVDATWEDFSGIKNQYEESYEEL
jgi:hypothetical protein